MKQQPASTAYRNVQAELWEHLLDEQKSIVAHTFRHLKNPLQIEVSEALMDFLITGIYPDPRDWSCSLAETIFTHIISRF